MEDLDADSGFEHFHRRRALAKTYTHIEDYRSLAQGYMGYCAVEFCQHLEVGGQHHKFYCVATIIWKKVPGSSWKESRWHCSVVRRELAA